MAGGGGGGDGEPEFQIAPMIDVLLVLLIFFMSITTAQVLQIDKDIKLPVAPDAQKKDDKNALNESAINVRWLAKEQAGKLKLDAQELPDEDMVDVLRERRENHEKQQGVNPYRVVIRADRETPAVEIQRVMTLIAQAGIDDISFSVLNREESN